MMQANLKFVMGQPMLTADELHKAGQHCIDLHNYCIQNYKTGQDIIVLFKDRHFLVGDDIFIITFSNLYDLFNLNALDISLIRPGHKNQTRRPNPRKPEPEYPENRTPKLHFG
jgi:hypothetical protein